MIDRNLYKNIEPFARYVLAKALLDSSLIQQTDKVKRNKRKLREIKKMV